MGDERPSFDGVELPTADDWLRGLEEFLPPDGAGGQQGLPPVPPESRDAAAKYLVISVAGLYFAAPVAGVTEVGRAPQVTPVPNVAAWLLGVTNLRGEILSLVDLRAWFGLGRTAASAAPRLLVVRRAGGEAVTGLIVDAVHKIISLSDRELRLPEIPTETAIAPYLRGVCEYNAELLMVLNLDAILLSPQMQSPEAAGA